MTFDPLNIRIWRVSVTLRLTKPVELPAYHGHVLHGLITRALDLKPFPRGLATVCVERWSRSQPAHSLYRFGMVGFSDEGARVLDGAQQKIATRGRTAHRGGLGSLDGCFDVEAYELLDQPDSATDVASLLRERGPYEIRIRTPLNLRRPRHNIRGGLSYINREDFPIDVFLSSTARRVIELHSEVSSAVGTLPPTPEIPRGTSVDASALININFRTARRETRNEATVALKPVEGVQGIVRASEIPDEWIPFLVLGSYAQIGLSLGYGQGRYTVSRGECGADEWCQPCTTARDLAMSPMRLAAAELRVRDNSDVRHDGWMPDASVATESVDIARDAVLNETYAAAALTGVLIPKKLHGVRALAVPTVVDRILQRAVHDALDGDIDQLYEDSSYAYRKGRSVRLAAMAIRSAQRGGFEWVLDTDITAFFDTVDWVVLADRLEGVLGNDPIVPVIMSWMRAPVRFAGRTYSRVRGLPQGAPLSPMLANLYLDALDEHLTNLGFALVRYADDFVVLCRDLAAARRAKEAAMHELASLGLTLNEDKTRIVTFTEGFHFLGFQFSDAGVTPEPAAAAQAASKESQTLTRKDIPEGSWLADVPLVTVKRVAEYIRNRLANEHAQPAIKQPVELVNSQVPVSSVNAPENPDQGPAPAFVDRAEPAWRGPVKKRPLFVVDLDVRLMLRGEKVHVTYGTGDSIELPLRSISHVTMLGPTRMTVPLLLRCADLDIPVYFCRDNGLVRAAISPAPDWLSIQRQLARADDSGFCASFARGIIQAKLHNSAALAVRFHFANSERLSGELRMLRDSCTDVATVEELMGYEGRGARLYFEGWAASLDSSWGFSHRIKHPPTDPVNALLSLAYTVVHQHVGSALIAAGLDPRIGFMHRARGAHYALASDIEEEFRHLAESVVWSAIQHAHLRQGDFMVVAGDQPSVRMNDAARRTVVSLMEQRMFDEFTPPGGETISYREFIDRQATALATSVRDNTPAYNPFRLHA